MSCLLIRLIVEKFSAFLVWVLKVSKSRKQIMKSRILPKNEWNKLRILVCFLEESKTSKFAFEIYWHLVLMITTVNQCKPIKRFFVFFSQKVSNRIGETVYCASTTCHNAFCPVVICGQAKKSQRKKRQTRVIGDV